MGGLGTLEFVPYDLFKNIEFIAEGGFSKIYRATWVDGPIINWHDIKYNDWNITRDRNYTVVLKKLNNSKYITSKELNEVFYQIVSNEGVCIEHISKYFGINQDPITKDMMIIIPYYDKGRRPFLDRNHDTVLIIDICDGLRPQIITNSPEGYIKLIKECWHSDPKKRPTTDKIFAKIWRMCTIYKSRSLSYMIQSAMPLRSSRSQSNDPFYYYQKNSIACSVKRKVKDDSVENIDGKDQSNKRRKFLEENNNHGYFTKEIELDINMNSNHPCNNGYVTKEIDLDINAL
ncbi:kinase-like domain-containing protein [Rhizophagus clarus]|uniref:Kinase-like domain-containing protein n=1 Tax=Rhizophagus clarus TaxID=94130 RepID=A0A8H3M218_9GLOM|nr:kinase-like domain-containing protein [Rhizophagus clarus]